jgi:predicted ArsR family transcriptional regulator
MKSTRQRLLDYLRAHPDATAADLAHGLRLTHSDVRYHLHLLLTEGVLAVTGTRSRGRGRPGRTLRLVSAINPQRFDLLSSALLAEALADLSPEEQESFLQRLAERLLVIPVQPVKVVNGVKRNTQRIVGEGGRPAPPLTPHPASLATRLVNAVERLNDLGYRARWEAHAESPRLILEHCPFSSLHSIYPELRRLDILLIEALVGEKVESLPAPRRGQGEYYAVFGIVVGRRLVTPD